MVVTIQRKVNRSPAVAAGISRAVSKPNPFAFRYGAIQPRADKVDDVLAGSKAQRRTAVLAARRAVPEEVRRAEALRLCDHLDSVLGPADIVCAYLPVGAEPGSPALVDRCLQRCGRVLLPITRTGADGTPEALWWGEYRPGALREGRLGGAYLDVTTPEPLPPDSPLWELPNVIISPHNSAVAEGNEGPQVDMFLANLRRWGRGEPMINAAN